MLTMNCSLELSNLKVFVKVLQALAKLGTELVIEAYEDGMLFNTTDARATGFAKCKLYNRFFKTYNVTLGENDESIDCKLLSKQILGALKNPNQMEKQVRDCTMNFQKYDPTLVFNFDYKCDAKKVHKLYLLQGQYLRLGRQSNDNKNVVAGPASVYVQILSNFQQSDEEITFDVSPSEIFVRNYCTGENNPKHIRSQYSFTVNEFTTYTIDKEYEITFLMKPFRALINLAEYLHLPVTLKFEAPGLPIVINFGRNVFLEVELTLATVVRDSVNSSLQVSSRLISHNVSTNQLESQIIENGSEVSGTVSNKADKTSEENCNQKEATRDNSISGFNFLMPQKMNSRNSKRATLASNSTENSSEELNSVAKKRSKRNTTHKKKTGLFEMQDIPVETVDLTNDFTENSSSSKKRTSVREKSGILAQHLNSSNNLSEARDILAQDLYLINECTEQRTLNNTHETEEGHVLTQDLHLMKSNDKITSSNETTHPDPLNNKDIALDKALTPEIQSAAQVSESTKTTDPKQGSKKSSKTEDEGECLSTNQLTSVNKVDFLKTHKYNPPYKVTFGSKDNTDDYLNYIFSQHIENAVGIYEDEQSSSDIETEIMLEDSDEETQM